MTRAVKVAMGFRSNTSDLVMLLEITALKVTGAFAGEAPAGTSKFFPGQVAWMALDFRII